MTHVYFSPRAEGRISYGHLGRTNYCFDIAIITLFTEARGRRIILLSHSIRIRSTLNTDAMGGATSFKPHMLISSPSPPLPSTPLPYPPTPSFPPFPSPPFPPGWRGPNPTYSSRPFPSAPFSHSTGGPTPKPARGSEGAL